jgi:hypothetical protein
MAIIISEGGKNAIRVEESRFEEEVDLQNYICANPESIPFDDIKKDIKLLILAKEFAVTVGSIDALGLDKEGNIYVVETKLYKNSDKRHVIAQVLDYGASLWRDYQDPSEFIRDLDRDATETFGVGLKEELQQYFALDGPSATAVVESMKANLKSGAFRFVVLMDRLHEDLKDLIVFINQSSKFTIFAVEMKHYKHHGLEIMIPKLFGAESAPPPTPTRWDDKRFFEDVEKNLCSKQQVEAVRAVYSFVTGQDGSGCKADKIIWGKGRVTGSFNPRWEKISKYQPFTVFSDGGLEINFGWLGSTEPDVQFRDKLKQALERIPGFKLPENYQDKFPMISAETWTPVVDRFIQTLRDLIAQ